MDTCRIGLELSRQSKFAPPPEQLNFLALSRVVTASRRIEGRIILLDRPDGESKAIETSPTDMAVEFVF